MSASPDVVVVGAGISGVACAARCAAAGLDVRLLDRGHRIGGRLATRTLHEPAEHAADTGAPYFTVSDDRFRGVVGGWLERGLAREWTDTFHTAGPLGLQETKTGPMRFASARGIRALVEDLADGLDVRSGATVEPLGAGRRVAGLRPRVVVLAMPGPHAAPLLASHHAEQAAIADQPYDPALSLIARFPARAWAEFDGAFVSNVAEVRWIADDGRSRGDDAPVLVAHSTPEFAHLHLREPEAALEPMLRAVRTVVGAHGDPIEARVQRWTFAQPKGGREQTFHLGENGIALCGDGWSARSKVEAAWLSGDDLGAAIVERLA